MRKIYVTKPFLPPMNEYVEKISGIWDNHILTNFGPLNNEFVEKLEEYLRINNLHYVTNGTLALQIAIDSLNASEGEIITTPFTFIATTSAIVWQKYKPVFVDIECNSFNIDVDKIEEKINEKTKAILAVHCFGFPCDVDSLNSISKKYNIPVIYDAAHCFGVNYNGHSLLEYGDISICSLHATKLFHSIEGGLCIANNQDYNNTIKAKKNFGLDKNYDYIGINAKATEFNAAMGLCVLNHFNEILNYRKSIYLLYKSLLSENVFIPSIPNDCEYNYAYFPVLFKDEQELLSVMSELNKFDIYPKRYFHPCINDIAIYKDDSITPNARDVSSRILCLPLDTYITNNEIEKICMIINSTIEKENVKILKIK